MSINIIDKKSNKKKKKKRNEIPFEEYAEKNNIKIGFLYEDEKSPEKLKKSDSNSNSIGSPKFENYYINKSYSRLDINMKKQNSASTNNSSSDDDIKEKEKDKKVLDYNSTYNKFEKAFIQTKILNSIKKGNNEYKPNYNKVNNNRINQNFTFNNTCTNFYPNQNFINVNNNQNLLPGIKLYYTNIDQNNTNNMNIRLDKRHMNVYLQNYQKIAMNNYMNMNMNNMNNMNNMKLLYISKQNLNTIEKKLNEVNKLIEDAIKEIKSLQDQTSYSIIISIQRNNLINYMKKKDNISTIENNDIKFCTNLKHPYYYTNHNEEIKVKSVLFLIEGLFLEEYLVKDYILIQYLDRDGYASLTQLKEHPQIVEFQIDLELLRKVFMEHRQNEVTETVETFDDILIRNKDWRNIKKKYKLNHKEIEQNLLKEMGKIRLTKIQNLMMKKSEWVQIQDKLLFQRHVNNQRLKDYQNSFNSNNNIIINNMNNNIYNNYYITKNNNVYNNKNMYNNNFNYNYINYNNNKNYFSY